MTSLQSLKRVYGKVDEMRKQRISLEKELRDLIQKDDITATLVTTERSEIKVQSAGPALFLLACISLVSFNQTPDTIFVLELD